jgi:hypothetical protein
VRSQCSADPATVAGDHLVVSVDLFCPISQVRRTYFTDLALKSTQQPTLIYTLTNKNFSGISRYAYGRQPIFADTIIYFSRRSCNELICGG